ncbi:hypothetical protein ABEB36_014308 [Hypothenemus hampei]|uniref:Uncharacterized protein n=1 Tax=Hypothenemus hampei TaxID=57062 RepID=A0ABD1E6S6_HYPHA
MFVKSTPMSISTRNIPPTPNSISIKLTTQPSNYYNNQQSRQNFNVKELLNTETESIEQIDESPYFYADTTNKNFAIENQLQNNEMQKSLEENLNCPMSLLDEDKTEIKFYILKQFHSILIV